MVLKVWVRSVQIVGNASVATVTAILGLAVNIVIATSALSKWSVLILSNRLFNEFSLIVIKENHAVQPREHTVIVVNANALMDGPVNDVTVKQVL